jgi:hypothetical protein
MQHGTVRHRWQEECVPQCCQTALREANVLQISEILLPNTDNKTIYLTYTPISCLKYNSMMLNAKHEVLTIVIYITINL